MDVFESGFSKSETLAWNGLTILVLYCASMVSNLTSHRLLTFTCSAIETLEKGDVSNRNTRKRHEICSKLIKTLERVFVPVNVSWFAVSVLWSQAQSLQSSFFSPSFKWKKYLKIDHFQDIAKLIWRLYWKMRPETFEIMINVYLTEASLQRCS